MIQMTDKNDITIISIEGIDTSGKSSQIKELATRLRLDGLKVLEFHFPDYNSPTGKLIKECLSNGDMTFMQYLYIIDQMKFFLTDSSDSMQVKQSSQFEEIIKSYDVLLLDRYDLSTIAYFIANSNEPVYAYKHITSLQRNLPKPYVTFILDLPTQQVIERKRDLDKIESNFQYLDRVRYAYKNIPHYDNTDRKYIELDACMPKDKISNIIYDYVKGFIKNTNRK